MTATIPRKEPQTRRGFGISDLGFCRWIGIWILGFGLGMGTSDWDLKFGLGLGFRLWDLGMGLNCIFGL